MFEVDNADGLAGPIGANRSFVHHMIGAALISFYGYAVCNFINGLAVTFWIVTLIPVFLLQWLSRNYAVSRMQRTSNLRWPEQAFAIEISVFIVGGAIIGLMNTFVHGFPIASGLKALLGFTTVGLFAAFDQGIAAAEARFRQGGIGEFSREDRTSFAPRMTVGIAAVLFSITAVVALLVLRPIELDGTLSVPEFQRVLVEIGFVLIVMFSYIGYAARRFTGLVGRTLRTQVKALTSARIGGDTRATVGTQDEFGTISVEINRLLDTLDEANAYNTKANDAMIKSLVGLAGHRDNETGEHLQRTQAYVRILCKQLAGSGEFPGQLKDRTIELITSAAPLHDIGKVAVPDHILLKPGKLTDDEFDEMKTHVVKGLNVIDEIIEDIGETPFLATARDVVAGHHERIDGRGYPFGLMGDEIPLAGRIMALADVYDALRSERIYKSAMSHEKARDIIIEGSGTQFDSKVVAAFLVRASEFSEIADELSDSRAITQEAAKVA